MVILDKTINKRQSLELGASSNNLHELDRKILLGLGLDLEVEEGGLMGLYQTTPVKPGPDHVWVLLSLALELKIEFNVFNVVAETCQGQMGEAWVSEDGEILEQIAGVQGQTTDPDHIVP